MRVIGLTGGSGTGKGTVAKIMREFGAGWVDADAVYREQCCKNRGMLSALAREFGDVITDCGSLDRQKLAGIVFNSPEKLLKLNELTYPFIMEEVGKELRRMFSAPVVLLDAPTLFETGADKVCDDTIGVLALPELRVERVMSRDGISRDAAVARISAQPPDSFYIARCGHILTNNLGLAQLKSDCEALYKILTEGKVQIVKPEELFYEKKSGFESISEDEKKEVSAYAEGYKSFLDEAKTERDAVNELVRMAEAKGFKAWTRDCQLKAGDRIYHVNRGKGVMLAVIGEKGLGEGIRLTAAHLDAPRIDIRTVPLYEDGGIAYLKTHYYGGIKKYQWPTIPLELRGVVCVCENGETKKVEVRIGDKPEDPKFVITDLLIHLASEQMGKKATEIIKGESMNILVGSEPSVNADKECKEKVKLAVMEYLNREYGMKEADFLSAELCCVPAFKACDIGFDRSLVGAYGHDDRVCSYPAATAILNMERTPAHTCVCLLVDKEEIGSIGVTGMQSRAFDTFMGDICRAQSVIPEECYENSVCLSADVCNAFDPNFPDVSEKRNDARINCGFALIKYTGSRGKSGTNDASAELMARVRCIFDNANVVWQTGQLGKVDQGGGGTVAMFLANRNIETVDAGVPVLSMHAPFECIAKLDLYMAYKGFGAFYQDK